MTRALPLLLLLCVSCSLRAPRVEAAACASTVQCDRPDVCFLGECRGHSAALTLVSAEVRPDTSSAVAIEQVGNIDLSQSVVRDFTLVAPLAATGVVLQEAENGGTPLPVSGALVVFTDHAPPIPDRVEQVTARTDSNGNYTVRLPQGTWDVLVQPAAPLPPYRAPLPVSTSSPVLTFMLPRTSALAQFQSGLSAAGTPVSGAQVMAVDPTGVALSAPATTGLDGGFSLYLPPDAGGYTLQAGAPPDVDAGTFAATDPLPTYDGLSPAAPTVNIDLTPVSLLSGVVVDTQGLPLAGVRVYARSVGMGWSLARSTLSDSTGAWTLTLRTGSYVVEAAPAVAIDSPGVSSEALVQLPSATPLTLTCPAKARGYGLIVRPGGGAAGANYQITATRLADDLLTTRPAFPTPTDSAGIWHITADPGLYRVEVVPTADSGLPRKIVQIPLAAPTSSTEIQLPQITLSPPITVAGVVHDNASPPHPISNATVSFYALDANGHSVLLGSAATRSDGSYAAILPDVAQPAAAVRR